MLRFYPVKKNLLEILIYGIDFNTIKEYNTDTIINHLKKIFNQIYDLSNGKYEIQINSVTYDMIHFGFPQYDKFGKQTNKLVQVDILLTNYPKFCKFYMYSPLEIESNYKGAHRNELLRAIAYVLSYEAIQVDKLSNPVKWKQDDLNSTGFYHEEKTLVDENGNKLKYKNTDEDLIPAYAKVIKSIPITHIPLTVIQRLVGNTFTSKDIDTFEKLFQIIYDNKNFAHSHLSTDILRQCAKSIKENNKLVFPEELLNFLTD